MLNDDKLKDECGVIGIFGIEKDKISKATTECLKAIQHRGQHSAGMAVYDSINGFNLFKNIGLVGNVFSSEMLNSFKGHISIGHVRYPTSGDTSLVNSQPLMAETKNGIVALAHNGNLINSQTLREELENKGMAFQTTIDTEVIINLIAKFAKLGFEESIVRAVKELKGAFSLTLVMNEKLIGVRDPWGFKPLCLGTVENGYVLASESCSLDVIGAKFIRDVEKGEIVIIDEHGVRSIMYDMEKSKSLCSFEFVYFAREDSVLDGTNVFQARKRAGKLLAKKSDISADIVIAVPDSGTAAALGYAEEAGLPFEIGLLKNKYMGRSFIENDQLAREHVVRQKMNPIKEVVNGKRIILVDDSLVRGTTSKYIIRMLKDSGALEVHLKISSPPVRFPCYFGIDTPTPGELIASNNLLEEIRSSVHADSLDYLSVDELNESIVSGNQLLCTACFNGDYPIEIQGL